MSHFGTLAYKCPVHYPARCPASSLNIKPDLRWEAPLVRMNLDAVPSLVEVADGGVARVAATHRSFFGECRGRAEQQEAYQQELHSFKRLEVIGDAFLNLEIIMLLVELYPSCNGGIISDIKSNLVSNTTLAYIAKQWALGKRLRMGGEERRHKIGDMLSVNADAFEAHIGGLVVGGMASSGPDGTRNLRNYVRAIFSPAVFTSMTAYAESRLAMAIAQGGKVADMKAVRVPTQADFSRKRKIWSTDQDVQGRFGEQPVYYPPKRQKLAEVMDGGANAGVEDAKKCTVGCGHSIGG